MPGFSGKYYYSLDGKGRIMVPAPFREIIFANYSPRLFVTNSAFDDCLAIYPYEEWLKLEDRVRGLPRSDKAVRYFMRRVIASAAETELDKQGRILVPAAHREDARLDSEVVLVGQVEMIELWSKGSWAAQTDPARIDREGFEESLSRYGL